MRRKILTAVIVSSALIPAPAFAQASEIEVLRQQLVVMQAEMARLSARLEELQDAPVIAPAVNPSAPVASQVQPHAPAAPPPVTISWRGAPEITSDGGWSFKPRGRLQIDAGTISSPAGTNDASAGFGSEIRRAFLGVEGKMPGGFGYRAEVDIASSEVEITELFVNYQASPELVLTLGQVKPFWGLEEMTSDLFTTLTERAAVNNAFGYERRLGVSGAWTSGPVIVQAGVFTDNIADLNDDENNSLSFDGRVVFAPELGDSLLHLAGSVHLRNLNDGGTSVRYRVRPFIHTPDIRFIDTGTISATGENGYGIEAAWIAGRFHATGEWHWQQVEAGDSAPDPTFSGGYAEVGMFLTAGDTRTYRAGVFDRIRPANPVGEGGIGAIQLNLRYDYLDLSDGAFVGGTQDGYLASLVWTPTAYTRLMLNYARLVYGDAALAAAGDRNYAVDSVGMRAQIDF